MAPKRQRRRLILSSDDDNEKLAAPPKQQCKILRKGQERDASTNENPSTRCKRSVPLQSDPRSQLPKAKQQKSIGKGRASKSISEFFKGQAQSFSTQVEASNTQELPCIDLGEEKEDLIHDDSSSDDLGATHNVYPTNKSVLDHHELPITAKQEQSLSIGSQSFKVSGHEARHARSNQLEPKLDVEDTRPWAEKYAPQNLEELAVHKRKVADVRYWLETALSGQTHKKLLILKGASGVGKTTTIHTLAKDLRLDISEWKNPIGCEFTSEGYISMSAQFEDFLGRSGKFSELEISGFTDQKPNVSISASGANSVRSGRKIVLIEEFPNTFKSTSSHVQSFRSHILEYLAAPLSHMGSRHGDSRHITPIVMVITETRLTTTAAVSDNFTAHHLLGPGILSHQCTSIIDFNRIAPTFLGKALELVIRKEAGQSGRRRIPGPSIMKKLGEMGDVRSALGSLEFLCLKDDTGDAWSGRVASKTKKGSIDTYAFTETEKSSLEMVTQRESNLGLFHAVGKVVYNKRGSSRNLNGISNAITQPSGCSPADASLRPSQVIVNQLIDETGTDVGTFIAALHENYVPSCAGRSFTESLNGCLDSLSDSDVFGTLGKGVDQVRNGQGAASDTLRQDEMSFQLAVRGLLFALPDPVQRTSSPIGVPGQRGGKGDAHKMFYPTSMRLSQQMEETIYLMQRYQSFLARMFNSSSQRKEGSFEGTKLLTVDREDSAPIRSNLNCTKVELVIERLPYAVMIAVHKSSFGFPKELEGITKFRGIDCPDDHISDGAEVDYSVHTDWSCSTSRPSIRIGSKGADTMATSSIDDEVEKLFLTDDDIEDDGI